ncbi:DUF599 domain-containing protein [Asticcacaulis sp. AC402]|uniref:DUF599 domain-containing protein n=1 Tax=Asticcacaulis sp. AC402 TaxID=1282361 RepID=UPI0003C3D6CF|nr:DUF599 family protein [Asticcacaulis sp. AC402]ESQ76061.1 hypothetical protein ABAC402_06335 [Asticcacaulis sp. AC402]
MSVLTALLHAISENPLDTFALIVFFFFWLGYEPFLQKISKKSGFIIKDLSIVRAAWMREATLREIKLFDSNLMAHAVNSAANFSSANLLLIAAVGGVLFSGQIPLTTVKNFGFDVSTMLLFQMKLGLIVTCLVRGLLDFIWATRQMNYTAAAFGSLPENMDEGTAREFAAALSNIVEPAMSSFSQGVRGYYFALASAAWLFGPIPLLLSGLGAIILLGWRQSRSQSARGIRRLRELLEAHPYPTMPREFNAAPAQNLDKNAAPHNTQA